MGRPRKIIGSMPVYQIKLSDMLRLRNKFSECDCKNCSLMIDELLRVIKGVAPEPAAGANATTR